MANPTDIRDCADTCTCPCNTCVIFGAGCHRDTCTQVPAVPVDHHPDQASLFEDIDADRTDQ